jgi:aspartate aminotransferase
MQLAQRTTLISPPSTSRMRVIANELKDAGVHVINFAAGELDVDTSEVIKEAAKKAVDGKRNAYTPTLGLKELRERIAKYESARCGVSYVLAEVGVTCGAKQALFNAMMVLVDPGDEVIIPQPYWVTFPTQVELAGATPVFVDTRRTGYHLEVDAIAQAVSARTKAIILNTPNNPTGAVYAEDVIGGIARLALARGIWVIFDECYGELVRSNHRHHNIVRLHPPSKERTILVNSFSKSHALTGWRVGYVCGPAAVIKAIENLQGHTTSNPCSISQYAVHAALAGDPAEFAVGVNRLLDERLSRALDIVGGMQGIRSAPTEGAFYLFLDISSKLGKSHKGRLIPDVASLCEVILTKANVAVVPGSAFGDPTGIRLSYAIATDDVVEGLQRLGQLLAEID